MDKKIITIILFLLMTMPILSGCLGEDDEGNKIPILEIIYPRNGMTVSGLVKIHGTAYDPDGNYELEKIEIMINNSDWLTADGTDIWSYDWGTYQLMDTNYKLYLRAWDGFDYSEIIEITVIVKNPKTLETDSHKWAIFVAAANYPVDNETKLGNGGLNLAEEMGKYFVENLDYSTSNIFILFDDGWIRENNGYGNKLETLQERDHEYNFNYGGATKSNFELIINYVKDESNIYPDSEIFIWLFGHGYGNLNDEFTGGKILESSAVFLWDEMIFDNELGDLLYDLRSEKTCIIVDACFSGGFADKTIYNFPTFFLMRSNIPSPGRIVLSGSSKFRSGYASTTLGPLFSYIWFNGLKSGDADGFKSGILDIGKSPSFGFKKDGKVSVEEAFYYTCFTLRTDDDFDDYKRMEPQINDQYPNRGVIRSRRGMFLGE